MLRARWEHGQRVLARPVVLGGWHQLGCRVRPGLGDYLPCWQGPPARGSRRVGFEAAAFVLQQPWSWPRMKPELRLVLPVVTARVQPEPAVPDAVRTWHGPTSLRKGGSVPSAADAFWRSGPPD